MRRTERSLVGEYRRAMHGAMERLRPGNASTVVALAGSPQEVRGFEEVKRRGIERFRHRLADLSTAISDPPATAGHLPESVPFAG
jgi:indolepyruvate ferredoxin oxidoreductase